MPKTCLEYKSKFYLAFIIIIVIIACKCGYGSDLNVQLDDTIVLVLEAENNSGSVKQVPIAYYLPQEVLPEYIKDSSGFLIKYDSNKGVFYLSGEMIFEPYETKTFYIKLKNVFFISRKDIDEHVLKARNLYEKIINSSTQDETKQEAGIIFDFIKQEANTILKSQLEGETVFEHIVFFRKNNERFDAIKNSIKRLNNICTVGSGSDTLISKDIVEIIIMIISGFVLVITIIFCHIWITRFKKDKNACKQRN